MYTREYSSADASVIWGGTALFGLAPDSGITVARNSDLTDEEVGMQGGDAVISILPDGSYTITITFQQESDGDRVLAAAVAEQLSRRILYRLPLLIKTNTGETVEAREAHIKTRPERTWGSTATGATRAWVFYASKVKEQSANSWGTFGVPLSSTIQNLF